MSEGFLVVDKPGGMTSHDVVARVRWATGAKKCGHAGTLDPMATGVVVVAVGRVTRLIRFLQELPKVYLATARFGVATDTLDADGEETARQVMAVGRRDIEDVLDEFTGTILQVPPMVSAIRKDGRRLYELAREGAEVERSARPVEVHALEVLDVVPGDHPDVSFRVECGKGTYVRSLADDIARRLGGFAHLVALRRLSVGRLGVDSAVTVDGLDDWVHHLITPLDALADYPLVEADADQVDDIAHGRPVELPSGPDGFVRVASGGRLLAMFRRRGSETRSEVVLT